MKKSQKNRWVFWCLLVVVIFIGFGIRSVHRHHPMRLDESATVIHFAMPNSFKAIYNYTDTNNHVFHSILVHFAIQLRGLGPTAVRLPSFLSGVALIPVGAVLAWIISESTLAGLLAATLLATSSLLVEYSVNARGHSMIALFSLFLGIAAVKIVRQRPNIKQWVLWSLAIILGMWTIPIMIYPAATFSLILIVQTFISKRTWNEKKGIFLNWTLSVFVCIGIVLLLYLPPILQNGFHSLFVFSWVRPHQFSIVLSELPKVLSATVHCWLRDTSWFYLAFLITGLVFSAVIGFRKKDLFFWMPFLALVVLIAFVFIQRIVLYIRIFLFVLPLVFISASCGLAYLVKWVSTKPYRGIVHTGIILFAVASVTDSGFHTLKRPYFISEDETTLVDAETICKDVAPYCDGQTALVGWRWGTQYSLTYYQILYTPGRIVNYQNKDTKRAFLALGDKQELKGLIASNPGFEEKFGELILWKTYPHSKVYLTYPRESEKKQ